MSDLPAVGSRWIHRESLCECEVLSANPREVCSVCLSCGATQEHQDTVEFHRDFIPDGPVTLEALERIGWERIASGEEAGFCRLKLWADVHLCCDGGHTFAIRTKAHDEQGRRTSMFKQLRPPESMVEILRAMRVFGKEPQP
jgi:hypothetical protein